jgi:hypothetical protein
MVASREIAISYCWDDSADARLPDPDQACCARSRFHGCEGDLARARLCAGHRRYDRSLAGEDCRQPTLVVGADEHSRKRPCLAGGGGDAALWPSACSHASRRRATCSSPAHPLPRSSPRPPAQLLLAAARNGRHTCISVAQGATQLCRFADNRERPRRELLGVQEG